MNTYKVTLTQEERNQLTEILPGVFNTMPKIAWLKEHRPEIYRRTDHFLLWADFICFMLGDACNHLQSGQPDLVVRYPFE